MIDLNNHTMVYTHTFVVDLKIQHTYGLSIYCFQYICLYAKIEILQTTSRLWVVHAQTIERRLPHVILSS
jgi:hypothetical protein